MTIHLRRGLPQSADVIFVLAGREYRKQYGLELFQKGLAPKVLFSVARFEIRRFSKIPLPVSLDLLNLASNVPPPQRHFFVLLEGRNVEVSYVRPRRFGTLTEIESLQRWLAGHRDVHSVVVISSQSHLKRVGICCRSLLAEDLDISLAWPPVQPPSAAYSNRLAPVFLEALKTLAYRAILVLRRSDPRKNSKIFRDP